MFKGILKIRKDEVGVVAYLASPGIVPEDEMSFFEIKGEGLPMSMPGEKSFPSQEEAVAHFRNKGFSLTLIN